ncbi:acyltransferase family protein [Nocardioides sp. SYSU DS0651]|uniref:acyltransferase family protein n=1 Tax=Nocardioides sp. SYSU DS0651 TaxID=3415955 RepID=UPI003F4B5CDD
MRALAVAMVLAFHLFPSSLTGGYVGVDVFFVVSGFLITAHLFQRPPLRFRDLLQFWARRTRRLLPASLLVLMVTLAASRMVAPETQWSSTASQARGAALYVVNWMLASDSVDYLAADDAPTPVQHYWSLSVEEQFYAGWPLFIAALTTVGSAAALRRHARPVLGIGVAAVVVASLAWSVTQTTADPARAYFATFTRIWEFGVGGILAWLVLSPRWRAPRGGVLVASLGFLAMLVAATQYHAGTPFPGWAALLPVLGSAAVIAADVDATSWLGRALAMRPVQWLGDVSYSVYLWHWPLIVLLPSVSGQLGMLDKIAVLAATLVLAGVTKRFVEDPFRSPSWQPRLRQTYLLATAAMAVVVALAFAQLAESSQRMDEARTATAARVDDVCFGAASLARDPVCAEATGAPVPAPILAAEDKSEAYEDVGGWDCWSSRPQFPAVSCSFGHLDGKVRIALAGNSHAGQWLPALQELAERNDWRIDTYLASQCALSAIRQQFDPVAHAAACRTWVRRTTTTIAEADYDLVVTSNRISVPPYGKTIATGRADYRAGFETVLRALASAGGSVLVIRDTPAPGDGGLPSIPACVATHGTDLRACSGPRDTWEPDDPVIEAVADLAHPSVALADFNDLICGPRVCQPVVGGAIVYFDGSHLTATYARTLAPFLEAEVVASLQ